jgi:hypothetical protein
MYFNYETQEMTKPQALRFLQLFDAKIGTECEINESDNGMAYVVCTEMLESEAAACPDIEKQAIKES